MSQLSLVQVYTFQEKEAAVFHPDCFDRLLSLPASPNYHYTNEDNFFIEENTLEIYPNHWATFERCTHCLKGLVCPDNDCD